MLHHLISAFHHLHLNPGDTLLVHASLNAIGQFENRAAAIIEALREVLGSEGTLLLPALSYETVTRKQAVFSQRDTPSCVGGLTEYFRQLSEVRRSIHPTHSVCAVGEKTEELLGNHHRDHTPCGPHSPFRKLKDIHGKILFLGCGLRPNTSMHGVEELCPPPYLYGEELEYRIEPIDGAAYTKTYRTHNFAGVEQRYDRVLDLLAPEDFQFGKVLQAEAYVIKAQPLWEKAYQKLVEDPLFFVD